MNGTFGEQLRHHRCRLPGTLRKLKRKNDCGGMTQEELARLAGIHRVNIVNYETGKILSPSLKNVQILANALGLRGSDLHDFFEAADHLPPEATFTSDAPRPQEVSSLQRQCVRNESPVTVQYVHRGWLQEKRESA